MHYARLAEAVNPGNDAANQAIGMLTQAYSTLGDAAETAALATVTSMARLQAVILSLSDIFLLLVAIFAGLGLMLFFVEKPGKAAGGDAH